MKIVLDSMSPDEVRLTTFQLVYPRFVHAEFMTHRVFSRNAMSSRAIPVEKMIKMVRENPAMPVHWGANQPGMQARAEVTDIEEAKGLWLEAAENACLTAEKMTAIGLHKQVVNRILEPFQWMRTIMTATEMQNYWDLRVHPDADPNIEKLASMMYSSFHRNTPTELSLGDWHIPYVHGDEFMKYGTVDSLKFSVARCARVSFNNHDGTTPEPDKDRVLHDRLVVQKPVHASPAEHQAVAIKGTGFVRNFRGWRQYRTHLEEGIFIV